MRQKSYRLIFASHSSTTPPSGLGKDNLGLHVGKSVCDKNHQPWDPREEDSARKHKHNLEPS